MTADDGRRWRALRAWVDDFPPDDQERLLGRMEHLLALAHDRDMGAFLEWVDTLFVLIERHERLDPQASGGEAWGWATRRPPTVTLPHPQKRDRGRSCGAVLSAWLPVAQAPDGAMLRHHLGRQHPDQARPYLERMRTAEVGTVATAAYEVVEVDE
jgi:hypothetical protein